ncbi:aminomethyl-transferring glycine dehydrogenase [Calditrichota bacterium]
MEIGREKFQDRHIGPDKKEIEFMLKTVNVESLDKLIDQTVPGKIRLKSPLNLPVPVSEYKMLNDLRVIADKNKVYKSFIGLGYYGCITPAVIQRNILENPGWYTQYTPYQSEISQGRLEALINFQTMISDLTGLEIANASLLDEGTAAAEAMTMLHRVRSRDLVKRDANVFIVSENCFPQTIEILKTRAEPIGIELEIGDINKIEITEKIFGTILQYPDSEGNICDYSSFIHQIHDTGGLVVVAADLLSLSLLTPPGEFGADIAIGSSQRFGVPMGYGGPHAAYFATKEEFKRQVPGRIIGVSVDVHGNKAYRMALQTREQHIRREKATSNICTAQALLAIMTGMYGIYHGAKGLRKIAERIYALTTLLDTQLKRLGFEQTNEYYFDTLKIKVNTGHSRAIKNSSVNFGFNFRYIDDKTVGISLDEATNVSDVINILKIFAEAAGKKVPVIDCEKEAQNIQINYPNQLQRKSEYLTHQVFNSYHSETKMMRYIKSLEKKDLSLTTSMIPLGSCTMKLNAATEMLPLTWAAFSSIHPYVPTNQVDGYLQVVDELKTFLCEITGFADFSMQPNSGAQGEYASLMVIRAFHQEKGEGHRNIVLIPSSAHGTNPASAIMAGMNVVIVKCDEKGNIDVEDLREKANENSKYLSTLMVTYPSTHGVFEEGIIEICKIIHDNGGQVFMDGANMNAQVGLTSPAMIGADICHLNLHKTFAIPHGGGGPGAGPIGAAAHLAPFLPSHPLVSTGGKKAISAVSSAPFGSSSILLISYAYIKMLGSVGLTDASKCSILNANYIKSRLEKYYPVLYSGKNGRVAHEMILELRHFKREAGVDVEDVAKRLMDYNFHAPTVSFPVAGTLMVEPTESESLDELDRFCEAMISIYNEIQEIKDGKADSENNLLKNAPHIAEHVTANDWNHPYSRARAAYPLDYISKNKFWPPVGRIDNSYGDRNLFCTCPLVEN